MKDYKEIADNVLKRSEKIIADNNKRKKAVIKTGILTVCFCSAVLIGFNIFKNDNNKKIIENANKGSGSSNENIIEDNVGTNDISIDDVGVDSIGVNDIDINDIGINKGGSDNSSDNFSVSHNAENNKEQTHTTPIAAEQTQPVVPPDKNANAPNYSLIGLPDREPFDPDNIKTMISSYTVDTIPCYSTPENGTVVYSLPLLGAMEEYKDEVLYRVFIDVFYNEELLSANSKEIKYEFERLSNLGYTVALETYFDGTNEHSYFTIHSTYEQLKDFASNSSYGYMLFLYDEKVISQ